MSIGAHSGRRKRSGGGVMAAISVHNVADLLDCD